MSPVVRIALSTVVKMIQKLKTTDMQTTQLIKIKFYLLLLTYITVILTIRWSPPPPPPPPPPPRDIQHPRSISFTVYTVYIKDVRNSFISYTHTKERWLENMRQLAPKGPPLPGNCKSTKYHSLQSFVGQ
jgi:hypothetical protein